jgi:hypothetical protein
MAALPPKADIRQRIEHVCLVPLADISPTERLTKEPLFVGRDLLTRLLCLSGGTGHGAVKPVDLWYPRLAAHNGI